MRLTEEEFEEVCDWFLEEAKIIEETICHIRKKIVAAKMVSEKPLNKMMPSDIENK
jgi:hypothetical protein